MNRGFIFVVSAVFALTIASYLVLALGTMQDTDKGKEKAFEAVAQSARDKAIVDFYFPPERELTYSPVATNQYYYCTKIPRYDPNNEAAEGATLMIQKCEGFG